MKYAYDKTGLFQLSEKQWVFYCMAQVEDVEPKLECFGTKVADSVMLIGSMTQLDFDEELNS